MKLELKLYQKVTGNVNTAPKFYSKDPTVDIDYFIPEKNPFLVKCVIIGLIKKAISDYTFSKITAQMISSLMLVSGVVIVLSNLQICTLTYVPGIKIKQGYSK